MVKVAIWCRHKGDSIIGIGPDIPWQIPSDMRRFRNITLGNTLAVGQKTYETFPNRTLPNRNFVVITLDKNYKVSDPEKHCIITDLNELKNYPTDLYISGGASIYKACFNDVELMPDVVIDSVYQGDMKTGLTGEPVTVAPCVDVMERQYWPAPQTSTLDNVITTVWLKDKALLEHDTVKKIFEYLKTENNYETVS